MAISAYKNLEVGKKEFIPVTEEEINVEIKKLLDSKTTLEKKEGKSELGDTVNIDYKGLLDDVAFEGGTAEHYDLELGSNSFIPGFEDQLVGYLAGSDVDVHVTFPEQYHAPNLAGKAVVFKCHIHEVKTKVAPEFNDDLAHEFRLESKDAMKEELIRQMNAHKKNEEDNEYLGRLMRTIIESSTVVVSDEAMKARVDEMYDYYESQIAQYGMDMNAYLSMQNMTVEAFRDQLASQAMESAQGDVVFEEIASLEGITATDEEVDHEIALYKDYYQIDDETFAKFKEERKNDVKNDILRRKTALFLIQNNN